jgi:hypothetical protein
LKSSGQVVRSAFFIQRSISRTPLSDASSPDLALDDAAHYASAVSGENVPPTMAAEGRLSQRSMTVA